MRRLQRPPRTSPKITIARMAKSASSAPLSIPNLRRIAKERLRDAKALLKSKRYDGGMYLCGYAVEMALKARICRTLKWTAFPTNKDKYRSFFVHDLDQLLNLSGRETTVKTTLMADWSVVCTWDPEMRYSAVGTATKDDLELMIQSTERLLARL